MTQTKNQIMTIGHIEDEGDRVLIYPAPDAQVARKIGEATVCGRTKSIREAIMLSSHPKPYMS